MEEVNEFTKYAKFSSPFTKDDKFINTKELNQWLPKGKWVKTEKVDGACIRLILTMQNEEGNRKIMIGSRKLILVASDINSKQFLDCLVDVNLHKIKEYFKDVKSTVTIYGEGYGAGIQKGGIYSPTKNFRVFDIRIGEAYQDWEYVQKVCIDNQLNLVPMLGESEEIDYDSCIADLKEHTMTAIKEGDGGKSEGLVIRHEPVLLNKYKERMIFKIKFKDFVEDCLK